MEKVTINGKEYLLDTEKAKQLGLLKETRVRSWEEYANMYYDNTNERFIYPNGFFTKSDCDAFTAFKHLLLLRNAWWGEWKPNFIDNEDIDSQYYISHDFNEEDGNVFWVKNCKDNTNKVFVFPNEEDAYDFLETFRESIETAARFI